MRSPNKFPIENHVGKQLIGMFKYHYFRIAGYLLLVEQPDGTERTKIGEDPNLSLLIYKHRRYSFYRVKEIYDYFGVTCVVLIPPDGRKEVPEA